MFALYMLSIFIIIAAGHIDARISNYDRWMDIFNEGKLIIIMYHLMTFTDFVPDPETQNSIGISCSVCVVLGTLANMVMLFVAPVKKITRNCRIRRGRNYAAKQRKLKLHADGARGFQERRRLKYKEKKNQIRELIHEIEAINREKREERNQQK